MKAVHLLAPLAILAVVGLAWWLGSAPSIDVRSETLVVGDHTRRFRIVTPRGVSAPPLVIALHGIGDTPESMAAYSRLDDLAVSHGFAVAYPEARRGMWATTLADRASPNEERDFGFLDSLVQQLRKDGRIDGETVHLVGMSNGGEFAQLYAFARRRNVASLTLVAATCPNGFDPPTEPVLPVLLIVGEDDPIVSRVKADAAAYRDRGHRAVLVTFPRVGHRWPVGTSGNIATFLSNLSK